MPLLLILVLLAAGCASSTETSLSHRAAHDGEAVAKAATAACDNFEAAEATLAARQKNVKLATAEITIDAALRDSDPHYGQELAGRRAAFEALAYAYASLSALAASTAPADTGKAVGSLGDAAAKLSTLPAWPAANFPSLSTKLGAIAQARSLQERNAAFAPLLDEYAKLWTDSGPVLSAFLMEDLAEYRRLVLAIRPDRFEASRLAAAVKEPFIKEANVDLYKLQLVTDAEGEVRQSRSQSGAVAEALRELAEVHRELARSRPDSAAVTSALDDVERLLGEK